MSEIEDPAATLARLLKTNMYVVKDNGGLANILVTGEWQNNEAFKDCDGQVTVGLAESADQKIELSGKSRRRMAVMRVNVWTTEQLVAGESGRVMRGKIVEEVNRIIRQNRAKPNETDYDFYNVGPATQTHKAYQRSGEASPNDLGWTELSSEQYVALWASDDNRFEASNVGAGEYAVALFGFRIESREKTAKKIALTFEGYGTSPSGSGFTVKAWNHTAGVWQNVQQSGGTPSTDETVTVELVADLPSYIDEDGYTWFLARTSGASDGETPAVLNCDYACCTVTVKGVTYCDIVSYRSADRVYVKPFVFRTEFIVKSWFFENIGE